MIKTVSKGEAIKATWANSIVNTLNSMGGINYTNRSIENHLGKGFQFASNAAFQIRYTKNGQFTINSGQIYVDGELICLIEDKERSLTESSYNMFGSLENWNKVSLYSPTSPYDLPIWSITIFKLETEDPDNKKPIYRAALDVISSDES